MIKVEVGANGIEYIEVSAINFVRLIGIGTGVVVTNPSDYKKIVQRKRILEQSKAFGKDNTTVVLDDTNLLSLPPKVGKKLTEAINEACDFPDDVIPKILNADTADGITSPLLFRLAQPLVMKDHVIEELEFQAKTFGDIEGVLAEMNEMKQAVMLIETIAKPVVSDIKLQALPSWAVDQISAVDGSFIMQEIMPRFLE